MKEGRKEGRKEEGEKFAYGGDNRFVYTLRICICIWYLYNLFLLAAKCTLNNQQDNYSIRGNEYE